MDNITIQKADWQRILFPFIKEQLDISKSILRYQNQHRQDKSYTSKPNCDILK